MSTEEPKAVPEVEPNVVTQRRIPENTSVDEDKNRVSIDEKNHQPGLEDVLDNNVASSDLQIESNEDIVRYVLDSIDDAEPEELVWTSIRMWVIGVGLSIFGAIISCIYWFKPQTVTVSGVFLLLIAYVLGEATTLIPRKGILKWLNPHRFTSREHGAIFIMASTAAKAAFGAEVLAVQKLYYTADINPAVAVFTIIGSQLVGYSFVGILRSILVWPTKCIYPQDIQYATTLQALHHDKEQNKTRLKIFYWCLGVMTAYTVLPEYALKWFIGVSIPCLAAPNSAIVSRLFGGSSGNEGLGFLSLCLDWNYIGAPMTQPIVTTVNQLIGYFLCIITFMGVYYGNVWQSKRFPFLSQALYYGNSTEEQYYLYEQTRILDEKNYLDEGKLDNEGLPWLAGTYVVYLIATNMALSATFVYMALHHWDVIRIAFDWMKPSELKKRYANLNWKFWEKGAIDQRLGPNGEVPDLYDDPHFVAMLKYKDVPQWWYVACLIISGAISLICCYLGHTQLGWWEFLVGLILAFVLVLFMGGLNAIFGFTNNMQTTIQMIGAYIKPGNPLANMMFVLYSYNSTQQAFLMLGDLKVAQYIKLPPRTTFAAQFIGTIVGGIFNFIMMNQIVTNQREILLSPQATSVWSGQNVQNLNSQGITWGALAKYLYSAGQRYQFVPYAFLFGIVAPVPFYVLYRFFPKNKIISNAAPPIFISNIGWLVIGINSGTLSYMIVAFASQLYLRKKQPKLFAKYNYIISAGLMGGVQICIFILSFAVNGAAGGGAGDNPMPSWWGSQTEDPHDPAKRANPDHCLFLN